MKYNKLMAAITFFMLTSCCPVQGPRGSEGKPGAVGASGPAGSTGAQGEAGRDGLNGSDGQDASPVTIVPLCPGVSNYGAFVEVGICLNGSLYGVYSDHGRFMTLLAPGHYSSNAIGSACNLTVGPNCTVTH